MDPEAQLQKPVGGRPRKATRERVTEIVQVRMTKAEIRDVQHSARRAGLSMSAFGRRAILGALEEAS